MALSTLTMAATNLIPIGSFALPALAGFFLIIVSLELNKKWAMCVYIGVSLLSIFISSDHTATIAFIVLFGYYPILKEVIEGLKNKVLEWIIKILTFNIAIVVGVLITLLIFGWGYLLAEYKGFGVIGISVFLLACNGAFVLFDIALTRFITLIIIKFIPMLSKLR